jgi:hypothetical protein
MLSDEDAQEAARMLRVLIDALPASTRAERATAQRIQGAAAALEVAAGAVPQSADSATVGGSESAGRLSA